MHFDSPQAPLYHDHWRTIVTPLSEVVLEESRTDYQPFDGLVKSDQASVFALTLLSKTWRVPIQSIAIVGNSKTGRKPPTICRINSLVGEAY